MKLFLASANNTLNLISSYLPNNGKGVADITRAVRADKIIYSGTSAGSMIASSDLSLCSFDDDEKKYVEGKKDFSGIGFVNFLIIPHTNNKDFIKSNTQMIEHLADNPQTLIFINDNQAVWVNDKKFEILSI